MPFSISWLFLHNDCEVAWMGPSGLSTGMSEVNEVRCSGSTKREVAHEVGPSGLSTGMSEVNQ